MIHTSRKVGLKGVELVEKREGCIEGMGGVTLLRVCIGTVSLRKKEKKNTPALVFFVCF